MLSDYTNSILNLFASNPAPRSVKFPKTKSIPKIDKSIPVNKKQPLDSVDISAEGKNYIKKTSALTNTKIEDNNKSTETPNFSEEVSSDNKETEKPEKDKKTTKTEGAKNSQRPKGVDGKPLTEEALQIIKDLKKRDTEVKRHEQAHIAASGGYVKGGANYSYESGPDGKLYAVGGEVSIDTSSGSTPEETIAKMKIVKRAALAPANPSAQDRSVASQAQAKQLRAENEVRKNQREKVEEKQKDSSSEKTDKSKDGKESNQKNDPSPDVTKAEGMKNKIINLYRQSSIDTSISSIINTTA